MADNPFRRAIMARKQPSKNVLDLRGRIYEDDPTAMDQWDNWATMQSIRGQLRRSIPPHRKGNLTPTRRT